MHLRRLCVIFFLIILAAPEPAACQRSGTDRDAERLDSLAHVFRAGAARLTSPELIRRKEIRREFQRRGYASILSATLERDGLGGLIAWARTKIQLDFHLPHNTLTIFIPVTASPPRDSLLPGFTTFGSGLFALPLNEDFAFPEDPWERK
jgi:hypothetical protein